MAPECSLPRLSSGIKGVSLFIILAIPATDVLTAYSLRLIDCNWRAGSECGGADDRLDCVAGHRPDTENLRHRAGE
ncbi:hypothetical protein P4S72_15180 [Vibrio sp. PP-XX7]